MKLSDYIKHMYVRYLIHVINTQDLYTEKFMEHASNARKRKYELLLKFKQAFPTEYQLYVIRRNIMNKNKEEV